MITPIEPAPAAPQDAGVEAVPTGVLVASTLCWLVGVLSVLLAIPMGIPAVSRPGGNVVPVAASLAAAVAVCVAGYLVRRRRRVGALLVVLAWALPIVVGLISGRGAGSGNVLLLAATVTLLFNWKHLR